MRVGIPSEVKNNEFRVAITPAGVNELRLNGHEVFVQRDAGLGSSITNEEYEAAGRGRYPEYGNLLEMYENSRQEGFGAEVKRRIMLGLTC